jgi:hypothetical protein
MRQGWIAALSMPTPAESLFGEFSVGVFFGFGVAFHGFWHFCSPGFEDSGFPPYRQKGKGKNRAGFYRIRGGDCGAATAIWYDFPLSALFSLWPYNKA